MNKEGERSWINLHVVAAKDRRGIKHVRTLSHLESLESTLEYLRHFSISFVVLFFTDALSFVNEVLRFILLFCTELE